MRAQAARYYADAPSDFFCGHAFLSGLESLDFADLVAREVALDNVPSVFHVALPSAEWFYDNATSVSVCSNVSMLADPVALVRPYPIGGIGSGVLIIHRGFLRFLPRPLALCYFPPSACDNLVSLGYLQKHGVSYASVGVSQLWV